MKKKFSLLFCLFDAFFSFSIDINSIEKMDSQQLQSLEKTIISCDSITKKYFQVRNSIKRFEGNENMYYSLGEYKYAQNSYEIIQVSNGYVVMTYLVSICDNKFPPMLLIDQIVGGVQYVSFEISKDEILINVVEPFGDIPYNKYTEIYSLDNFFSEIKVIRNEGYNEVPLITNPE